MMNISMVKYLALSLAVGSLVGCAGMQAPAKDYTAFEAAKPKSILILPPLNQSPDVKATNSVYAQVSRAVGESGYYVMPVGVVHETFLSNGATQAEDIQQISLKKINEVFAPDAILYLNVKNFGSSYKVIASETTVALEGKLIDAKTGQQLWDGKGMAFEQSDQSGGLLGSLVNALVKQVSDSNSNKAHKLVPEASASLLSAKRANGFIYGPYSLQQGEPKQ